MGQKTTIRNWTAGFRLWFHLPGQPILGIPIFEPWPDGLPLRLRPGRRGLHHAHGPQGPAWARSRGAFVGAVEGRSEKPDGVGISFVGNPFLVVLRGNPTMMCVSFFWGGNRILVGLRGSQYEHHKSHTHFETAQSLRQGFFLPVTTGFEYSDFSKTIPVIPFTSCRSKGTNTLKENGSIPTIAATEIHWKYYLQLSGFVCCRCFSVNLNMVNSSAHSGVRPARGSMKDPQVR